MKSFVSFLIVCSLLLASVSVGAQSQGEIDEINSQIDKLKDAASGVQGQRSSQLVALEAAQARLIAARSQVDAAQAKVDAVTADIVGNEAFRDELNRRLDRLAIEIATTRLEIREARIDFQERAAEMYMERAATIGGAVVVNIADMASVSVAARYSDDVIDSSERLLNTLEILERTEENQQVAIEENQREVAAIIAELEVKRGVLEEEKIVLAAAAAIVEEEVRNAQVILDEINAQIAEIEGEIAELEADAIAIAEEIRRLARTDGTKPGVLQWPVNGTVTSGYGYRVHPITGTRRLHTGLDISAGSGTTIYAAGAGNVIWADWYGGYGKTVIVDHGGGLTTLYAHQSTINVSVGSSVSSSSVVGYVGSTGFSTGPHLHFETREWGTPVNPMNYLSG